MTTHTQAVFYSAARRSIVARRDPRTGGSSSGKTMQELVDRYGALEILPLAEAIKRINAQQVTKPIEIDGDKFFEMLAVIPPQKWKHSPGAETFQLDDTDPGNVTLTLGRVGARYFQWYELSGKDHGELVAKVSSFVEPDGFRA